MSGKNYDGFDFNPINYKLTIWKIDTFFVTLERDTINDFFVALELEKKENISCFYFLQRFSNWLVLHLWPRPVAKEGLWL